MTLNQHLCNHAFHRDNTFTGDRPRCYLPCSPTPYWTSHATATKPPPVHHTSSNSSTLLSFPLARPVVSAPPTHPGTATAAHSLAPDMPTTSAQSTHVTAPDLTTATRAEGDSSAPTTSALLHQLAAGTPNGQRSAPGNILRCTAPPRGRKWCHSRKRRGAPAL